MTLSSTVNRKFIKSIPLENLEIETDLGWKSVSSVHKTIPYLKYRLETVSGLFIECADNHIVFDSDMNEVFVKDLIPYLSHIITKNGIEVVVKNECLQYEEEMYDITVDSDEHRFYSNGILSHNSTIYTALTFCLFGKTTRNVNLNQLINSINGKDCLIELEFTCYNDEYIIRRGLKPTIFDIIKNGTLINNDSKSKDYQKYLEEHILRTDFRTFTTVITIGGRDYIPFMKQPKSDRRRIIESLLNIDIFSLMNKLAKARSQELQNEINIKKQEIKALASQINFIKESIDKNLSILAKNQETNKDKIDHYNKKIEILDQNMNELESTLDKITSEFGNIEELYTVYNTKKEKMNSVKHINIQKFNALHKDKKFYLENNNCPTCEQVISEEVKHHHINKLEKNSQDIETKLELIDKSLHELDQLHSEIQSNLKHYNTLLINKNSLLQEKSSYISIINELSNISSSLTSTIDIASEEKKLAEYYKFLNKERDCLDTIINETEYYDFCQLLLKDEGVKTLIIKEYLPKINLILNKFLEELDLFIDFQFDENFNEQIKSRHRDIFSYESFSDGQKMKIDVALLFTWREIAKLKNSLNINILFCDEIADSSCDPIATGLIVNLLNNISTDTKVFIISHRSELFESNMERILQLELVNNFTQLKEII